MPQHEPLLELQNLTVRKGGQIVLQDISFQLNSGECRAIVGLTGSGKTTLLQALAGQFPALPGARIRRAATEFVSFKEESSRFSYSSYFYQQRYQATMAEVPETIGTGYTALPTLRDYLQLTDSPESAALVNRLGLMPLLNRSFIKLSNGQTRKARMGKALLRQPAVLLLDNPFVGLDATFRAELTVWLHELVNEGLTLVLVTEEETIPAFVTHVIRLENGHVQWSGPQDEYVKKSVTLSGAEPVILQKAVVFTDFEDAFKLRDVTVQYGETVILNNLNWTVRAGERWALVGPNGAGKSVLLSLLYGDHPQAYANDVRVFGHRRGKSGESIWDVKRRIGFVSPELHLYFPQNLTARQVALTGLTDTLTPPGRVRPETEQDLRNLLTYFGQESVSERPFGTLSAGEQRVMLLIRAFLKNAPVLLLDEPFQAMDASLIHKSRQLIDSFIDKTILFVTHDRNELPDSIDRLFAIKSDTSLGANL